MKTNLTQKFFFTMMLAIIALPVSASAASPIADPKGVNNAQMIIGSDSQENLIINRPTYYDTVKGYLARPREEGNYPGIVMIHEWWGLNENIETMARVLANQGYVVLAVDLYKGEATDNPTRAAELSSSINQVEAVRNLRSAVSYLKSDQGVGKVASLGWCFGGGQSLQLALSGVPLNATVIYYGQLTADRESLSKINWPVLGIFGTEDQVIPVDSVRAFDTALDELGKENEIHLYPGVGHAFANPSGTNYAPNETKDAWAKTIDFLNRHLK